MPLQKRQSDGFYLRQRKDGRQPGVYKPQEHMSAMLVITEDMVREALRQVIDPELGENLVDLGLVYGVTIEGNHVAVDLTLTTLGCPLHASLHAAAERAIRLMVPGLDHVHVQVVFEPRWTPDLMSDAAKHRLGFA